MDTLAEAGREFWRGELLAGGFTAIPRWAGSPVPGVAECEVRIPDELVAGLRRLAGELAVPLSSVLLAAHARVLAALSGEGEVVTGYLPGAGGRPVPCRLATEAGSWRALLRAAGRMESVLRAHRDFPVEELRGQLGLTGPMFETVCAPTGADTGLAAEPGRADR